VSPAGHWERLVSRDAPTLVAGVLRLQRELMPSA